MVVDKILTMWTGAHTTATRDASIRGNAKCHASRHGLVDLLICSVLLLSCSHEHALHEVVLQSIIEHPLALLLLYASCIRELVHVFPTHRISKAVRSLSGPERPRKS